MTEQEFQELMLKFVGDVTLRLGRIEEQLGRLNARLTALEKQLGSIEARMLANHTVVLAHIGAKATQLVQEERLRARVRALESGQREVQLAGIRTIADIGHRMAARRQEDLLRLLGRRGRP
jgi:hypothetical protein